MQNYYLGPLKLFDIAAGKGGFKIIGEAERDYAGHSVAMVGDVNGDGYGDVLIGAWQNTNYGGDLAGAAYLVFGKSGTDAVRLADVAAGRGGFKIFGENDGDRAGSSVSAAGDLNGDGRPDLLVGAFRGGAYAVFGKSDTATVNLDAITLGRGGFNIGAEIEGGVGGVVSGAGDVNGDGRPDILVGYYGDSAGGYSAGAAYVVFGRTGTGSTKLSDVAAGRGGFKIVGESNADWAGFSVSAAGDVNGDGLSDLLVGAPGHRSVDAWAGAAYLVFGKADTATVDLDAVAAGNGGFKIIGKHRSDSAGYSVSAAGDVNGDGRADLLVGSIGDSGSTGAVSVVFGKADTTAVDLNAVAAGSGGFKIIGENANDQISRSITAAGDVNGDGFADLLIGADSHEYMGGPGAAYLVFGKADTAAVKLSDVAAGRGGFKIVGEAGYDFAGYSVSALGDVNADGLADLLVGARGNDAGGTDAGAAYVIFGSRDWFA